MKPWATLCAASKPDARPSGEEGPFGNAERALSIYAYGYRLTLEVVLHQIWAFRHAAGNKFCI